MWNEKNRRNAYTCRKARGQAVIRSLQGTVFLAKEELKPGIETFVKQGADWVILTTGIGTDTLIESAEELQLGKEFMNILSNAHIASRGYKTFAALKNAEFSLSSLMKTVQFVT